MSENTPLPSSSGTPGDSFTPAPKKKSRAGLIVGALLGVLILAAAGLYLAGYLMAGDKTPKNASVDGVAIGGLTEQEAVAKLEKELGPQYDKPIALKADDKTVSITPSENGMTVDFTATVKKAGAGKSLNPSHIWNVLSGGSAIDPVTDVDDSALERSMGKAAGTFKQDPKDATIKMDGIKVVTTPHEEAVSLDEKAAAKAVVAAWPTRQQVEAPLTRSEPAISTADVEKAKKEYGDPAVSAPITVKAGDKTFPVDVKTIAAATTFEAKDGAILAKTDMEKVWKDSQAAMENLKLAKAKDASFVFKNNRPVVQPAVDGVGVDKADFTKVVQPAITRTGAERTVTVKVSKKPAELTTEEANKLGVKEVTGEFTTYFPYAEYRNVNLSRAASILNGKLVKPGETFSMNDTLGERTAANGYVDGYVIQGSRLVKETGGGVSQSATTVFNAIFFAGLEDVEHHPHTLYFPRYPAGREATLYYGHLDLKFKNNTNHGVVIQAYVKKATESSQGSITVKIWSTKTWDAVKSTELVKSNYYDAPDQTSDADNCEPQSPSPGFTVNYSRQFIKGGKVVKTEPFRWTYAATPKVTCKK